MASASECEAAVHSVVSRLADLDPDLRRKYVVDRTVSCRISDLGVTWSGRLCDDGIQNLSDTENSRAQVRLTVDSDDLLAIIEGTLPVPAAVAVGRLRVQANPLDLLRLRTLL